MRSEPDARQDYKKSNDVINRERFTQKRAGEQRTVNWDDMHERAGAVGPNKLDTAVPCGKGEQAGKDRYIDDSECRQQGWLKNKSGQRLPQEKGHCTDCGDRGEHEHEAEPVNLRSEPQVGEINTENRHIEYDDEIAPVERKLGQRRKTAARDDDQHADQRSGNPEHLDDRDAVAEHQCSGEDDENWC